MDTTNIDRLYFLHLHPHKKKTFNNYINNTFNYIFNFILSYVYNEYIFHIANFIILWIIRNNKEIKIGLKNHILILHHYFNYVMWINFNNIHEFLIKLNDFLL